MSLSLCQMWLQIIICGQPREIPGYPGIWGYEVQKWLIVGKQVRCLDGGEHRGSWVGADSCCWQGNGKAQSTGRPGSWERTGCPDQRNASKPVPVDVLIVNSSIGSNIEEKRMYARKSVRVIRLGNGKDIAAAHDCINAQSKVAKTVNFIVGSTSDHSHRPSQRPRSVLVARSGQAFVSLPMWQTNHWGGFIGGRD